MSNILSESNLPNLIRSHKELIKDIDFNFKNRALYIEKENILNLISDMRKKIESEAFLFFQLLEKRVLKNNTILSEDMMRLKMLTELFKSDFLIKNSHHINYDYLSERFLDRSQRNKPIQFLIGWGQCKRDAGLLKVAGPYADCAELIALGLHAILVKTVEFLHPPGCTLHIISGGKRFTSAYHTNQSISEDYDNQRALFVESLGFSDKIFFIQYLNIPTTTEKKSLPLSIHNSEIERLFNPILLNIDWYEIYRLIKHDFYKPHFLSNTVRSCLKRMDEHEFVVFIRKSIIDILTDEDKKSNDFHTKLIEFVKQQTRNSAFQYIKTHHQHTDLIFEDYFRLHNIQPIRLTVHAKANQPNIPALYILGKTGNNLLPQHCSVGLTNKDGIKFITLFEVMLKGLKPIYIKPEKNEEFGEFSWFSKQPFLYVDNDVSQLLSVLSTLTINEKLFEDYEKFLP